MEVTVIVPVYNEEATVPRLLEALARLPVAAQILIVNDGSRDGTASLLDAASHITVLTHSVRRGKGSAIRTALPHASAPITIIQDADLEYDPREIPDVIRPLREGTHVASYGNRFHQGIPRAMPWPNRLINRWLVRLVRVLYGIRLSDEATCYKAIRTDILRSLNLRCQRFEYCPEVTAKLLRLGHSIAEIPLHHYTPRTTNEGKKIRWTDAVEAIATLYRYRHWNPEPTPSHPLG